MVLAYAIGSTGLAANAFAASIKIPNTVYTLIITGALTAVLVPQITKAALAKDGGRSYINKLVSLAIVGSAALLPVLAILTPWLIAFLGAGWDNPQQTRLATLFAFWLLPQVLFYSLYTVVGEVLNAKSFFGPYAWSPVLNNIISIAGLLAFVWIYGADPAGSLLLERWDLLAILLVAGSATLGVAVQGLALFAFWKRVGLKFRFDLKFRGIGLGTMGKVAFWTFLTVLVAQLVGLINSAVLSLARPDEAGLAAFELVNVIFVMPHAIITISLVTANFTRMSESVHSGDLAKMKRYLAEAARLALISMLFFTAAMILLAFPLIRIIQWAAPFDVITLMAKLLIVTLICLAPYSLVFVLNRGFFALSDTRTPFFIALVQSALIFASSLWSSTLPTHQIAYAISLLISLIITAQAIATFIVLRTRIGSLEGRRLLTTFLQSIIAIIFATAGGAAALYMMGWISETSFPVASFLGAFISSGVVTLVMGVIYIAVLLMLKNTEAILVVQRLKRLVVRG